ncbi:hypothetical protein RHGRI_015451 [Rhododendron griersonianum]|uniref:Clathrin light chain n=1 Tax=Rhododendron griersonianum TaxID=479676 RepID=A0AAV6KDB3_9ERIC|nr:hypothetical protein RHGRI_015451 [Rhododendron griersonianum]
MCRLNAIRLEEKEKREKELLREIIEQAEEYKTEFYRRRKLACENNKVANREKEKIGYSTYLLEHCPHATQPSAIPLCALSAKVELIPNEVPTIKKRGKKEKAKQPSIAVIQGPKPGKPTDLSRMRHILVKLKHNPPPHMNPPPPPPSSDTEKDGKARPSPPVAANNSQ